MVEPASLTQLNGQLETSKLLGNIYKSERDREYTCKVGNNRPSFENH